LRGRIGECRWRPRAAPRRRIGALARSDFGQASSNDAGGASVASGGGAAGDGGRSSGASRSGANGSPVRAWARSRSFRELDENKRLRFGLAGAASVDSGPGGASTRTRSRDSSCQGGGDVAGVRRPVRHCPRFPRPADRGRTGNPRVPQPVARRSACRGQRGLSRQTPPNARAEPPRNGPQFSDDHPETEHDHPVQAATAPATIMVLPRLNSLIEIPKANRQQARSRKPNPATNNTAIIELTPGRHQASPHPPPPRYRHIVCIANRQLWMRFPPKRRRLQKRAFPIPVFLRVTIAALHQENLSHNCQLLGKGTALYGCGNEAHKRQRWAKGTPGYQ